MVNWNAEPTSTRSSIYARFSRAIDIAPHAVCRVCTKFAPVRTECGSNIHHLVRAQSTFTTAYIRRKVIFSYLATSNNVHFKGPKSLFVLLFLVRCGLTSNGDCMGSNGQDSRKQLRLSGKMVKWNLLDRNSKGRRHVECSRTPCRYFWWSSTGEVLQPSIEGPFGT